MNKLNRHKHQNTKKLKTYETDITNLVVVQRSLTTKIEQQTHKNDQLQSQINDLRPQIDNIKKLVEEHKKKIELEMYELTLKRQRIRTYVQSLQRDTGQQKEDYDLMLEEERDKIKIAVQMVEDTMAMKKRLETSLKKAEVCEKERDRDLSNKRGKLKRQMQTALVCAAVDLSKVNDKNSFMNQSSFFQEQSQNSPKRSLMYHSSSKKEKSLSPGLRVQSQQSPFEQSNLGSSEKKQQRVPLASIKTTINL